MLAAVNFLLSFSPIVIAVGAGMEIEYFEMAELPGKRFFRCERRQASLQVDRCVSMFMTANSKGNDNRYHLCLGCDVGAVHAGVSDASKSGLHGKPVCARCLRGTTRLVEKNLCVSCANRSYEWLKGRNARGRRPVMHPELFAMSIRYRTGGKVKTLHQRHCAANLELVVAALRDEPKQVQFAFAGGVR